MSFRNTSRLSNGMDPDNAQHFNLNLPSAVDKVYQRNSFSRQIFASIFISDNGVWTFFCFLKTMCVLGHQESGFQSSFFVVECYKDVPVNCLKIVTDKRQNQLSEPIVWP